MRECAFCDAECDSSIGMYRELKSEYWGGKRHGNVEYSPKLISFYCSDDHRNEHIAVGGMGERVARRTDSIDVDEE